MFDQYPWRSLDPKPNNSLEEIKKDFDFDEHSNVDRYINWLLNEEIAFLTECPEYFPITELHWKSPTAIANAVIDNYIFTQHNYSLIIKQLKDLRCLHLEIRFFDSNTLAQLTEILNTTDQSTLKSIDILLKYQTNIKQILNLNELLFQYKRINNVFIHSTPEHLLAEMNTDNNLFFTAQTITDETHCGIVNQLNFSSNIQLFTESVNFNNCLNRKISIDGNGHIKNCPSMQVNYGHINDTALIHVIEDDNFRKLWDINKDQINICQDCEFRYICTDCRAYLKDNTNLFSKPLKCNYDPYVGEWKN